MGRSKDMKVARNTEPEASSVSVNPRNERMLGFQGPAQPSPALGDALNAGYRYLEVKCLGCSTHQIVALDIVRRPKATPVHELERYMRCKDCSRLQGRPFKRAILWRCGRPRFRPMILRQRGGPGSARSQHDSDQRSRSPR